MDEPQPPASLVVSLIMCPHIERMERAFQAEQRARRWGVLRDAPADVDRESERARGE